MDTFSEQCDSFPWALKLKKLYKRLRKERMKENSYELLNQFITRSVKITLRETQNYHLMEDIHEKIPFMEKLIFTLNEENAKQVMVIPNFDDMVLPIMEKYLEVLVFQSQKNNSSKESMQCLTQFLKSLPCHPSLKISNGARCKSLLTQLLTNHQRKSQTCVTGKQTVNKSLVIKSSIDESLASREKTTDTSLPVKSKSCEDDGDSESSSHSNPSRDLHQNDSLVQDEDFTNNNLKDSLAEELSSSKIKPVLNSTSLRNEMETDEEDGDLSVSGNESTNNSLEGDNSSDVEFPVSRKKDGNSSTCLVNSAQKVLKKTTKSMLDEPESSKEILPSTIVTHKSSTSKKRKRIDDDSSDSENEALNKNLDRNCDKDFLPKIKSSQTSRKQIETGKESVKKSSNKVSKELPPKRQAVHGLLPPKTKNKIDDVSSSSKKETQKKISDGIVADDVGLSSKKKTDNIKEKPQTTYRSSDEVASSQDEFLLSKNKNIRTSTSFRKLKDILGDSSDEGDSSEEERPFKKNLLSLSQRSRKQIKTVPDNKTDFSHSDSVTSSDRKRLSTKKKQMCSSTDSRKSDNIEYENGDSSDSRKQAGKKNLNEVNSSEEECLRKKTAKMSSKKQIRISDENDTSESEDQIKQRNRDEDDSSAENFPSRKKLIRNGLSKRRNMIIDSSDSEGHAANQFSVTKSERQEYLLSRKKHAISHASSVKQMKNDNSTVFEKISLTSSMEIEPSEEEDPPSDKDFEYVETNSKNHVASGKDGFPVPKEHTANNISESEINDSCEDTIYNAKSKNLGKGDMSLGTEQIVAKSPNSFANSIFKNGIPHSSDIPGDDGLFNRFSSSSKPQENPCAQLKEAIFSHLNPDLRTENCSTDVGDQVSEMSKPSLTYPPDFDPNAFYMQPEVKNRLPLSHLQMILRRRFRNPFITLTEKQRNYNVLRLLTKKRKFTTPHWEVTKWECPSNVIDSCVVSSKNQGDPSPTAEKSKFRENSPDLFANCGQEIKDSPGLSSTDNHLKELQKNMKGNIFGCEASTSDIELMEEIESNVQFWRNIELNSQEQNISPKLIDDSTKTNDKTEVNAGKILKLSISKSLESTENKENRESRRPMLNIKYTQQTGLKRKATYLESSPGSSSSIPLTHDEETSSPAKKKTLIQTKITQSFSNATSKTTWETLGKMLPSCWLKILQNHVQTHNSLDQIPCKEFTNQPLPFTILCGCVKSPVSETK